MSDTLLMPFTVLSAEFAHETNTFSRRHTTHADFMARSRCLQGDAAIAARGHANTKLGGFLEVARLQEWRLVHVLSASANPGGPVTEDAFERLAGLIVDAAHRHRGALDGIALGLHGAMSTTRHDDGEGELLGRLRAMAGEIRPVTLRATLPMLGESSGGRTDRGPMLQWLAEARAYEAAHADAFAVSLNAGFSHADLPEMGPTVLVTCQGALARHQSFADHLATAMWDARFARLTDYLSVAQAAARCLGWPAGRGPLVVADYADNPGGGAYGDSTSLLAALLDAGVQQACFGPMVDPAVAAQLLGEPVGTEVDVLLGGKTDPRLGGGPLALRGRLRWCGEGLYTGDGPMIGGQQRSWGPTAVLQVQGIAILVVTHAAQMWDQQQFKAFGIDPQAHRVVALKSAQHFRAAFEPIAGEVIVCDSKALAGPDCTTRRYERAPRPVFPLEQDIDLAQWRAQTLNRS